MKRSMMILWIGIVIIVGSVSFMAIPKVLTSTFFLGGVSSQKIDENPPPIAANIDAKSSLSSIPAQNSTIAPKNNGSTDTNSTSYATMIVRRVQNNPEIYIHDNSTRQRIANAPIADGYLIQKYPQLKDAEQAADQRLLNLTSLCSNNGCSNSLPLPVYAQPNYIIKIPEFAAEGIISEQALKFQLDPSTLPKSHVYNTFVNNAEGITYAIDIFLSS